MKRVKRLVNWHESVTRDLLGITAERHGVRLFAKPQVAEALPIRGSGISNDLFTYALKASFDFVVATKEDEPLFAVEFDGAHHDTEPDAQRNDIRKNQICDEFELPLARVRDEHIFQQARGLNYLTWLTELYFGSQAIEAAYKSGIIPPDDYVDPLSFVTIPHLSGHFPLFLSSTARIRLRKLSQSGVIIDPVPLHIRSYSSTGAAQCLVLVGASTGDVAFAIARIYLSRFGVVPTEIAEELAIVSLERTVNEFWETGKGAFDKRHVRDLLIRFLKDSEHFSISGSPSKELGFKVSYRSTTQDKQVEVGPLDGEPAVLIRKRHFNTP